jgi:hypothetical protein
LADHRLQASTITEFAKRLWPVLSKLTEGGHGALRQWPGCGGYRHPKKERERDVDKIRLYEMRFFLFEYMF